MELDATKPIMVREALLITRSAPFICPTGYRPTSLLWRCDPGLHGHVQIAPPTGSLPAHRLFAYLGAGYLVGPIIGSTLWRVTHRRTMALIEARDREFHQHVVKNRVDPTAQSATNPVPDFYGE